MIFAARAVCCGITVLFLIPEMLILSKCLLIFALAGLVVEGSASNLNESCVNPAGESGHCIRLGDCESLKANLTDSVSSSAAGGRAKQSKCGFFGNETMVCCSLSNSTTRKAIPEPPNCGIDHDSLILPYWTTLLRYDNRDDSMKFTCGGSLINSRDVLAVAHCVSESRQGLDLVTVRLEGNNLTNKPLNCDRIKCSKKPVDMDAIIHQDFSKRRHTMNNDIALVRLAREVWFSNYSRQFCLPVESYQRSRNTTGWGAIVIERSDSTTGPL